MEQGNEEDYSLEWRLQNAEITPDKVLSRQKRHRYLTPCSVGAMLDDEIVDAVYYVRDEKLRVNEQSTGIGSMNAGKISFQDYSINRNPLLTAFFGDFKFNSIFPAAGYLGCFAGSELSGSSGLDGLTKLFTQEYGLALGLGAYVLGAGICALARLMHGEMKVWGEYKKYLNCTNARV